MDLLLGVQVGTDRSDHHRDLRSGDVLVLYTDGLVERRDEVIDEGALEELRQEDATLADQVERFAQPGYL